MKKIIVTTTINNPTEAIEKYDNLEDWELIAIGDKKTPNNYKLKKGHYITPAEQEKFDKKLSDAIGWNCIQRRNFGFIFAKQMGADIVATIDDDNIPYDGWGKNLMIGKSVEVNYFDCPDDVFDPIGATNYEHLWHRGFPLTLIPNRNYKNKRKKIVTPEVQADFWDGDPDIDAFCRLEHSPECKFDESFFPISSNKISPFNSQNTFLKSDLLKDYFMFPHIGRMDDIWGAYYLGSLGYTIIYGKPTVYQDRNNHDLINDLKQEYLGYENNINLVNDLKTDPLLIQNYLPPKSFEAFTLYRKHFD